METSPAIDRQPGAEQIIILGGNMSKLHSSHIFVLGACAAFLAAASFAQAPAGPHRSAPMYNPATEVTVKGTVDAVTQQSGPRGWVGTHLTLKTDSEKLDVHVGPSWFLTKSKIAFAKGDQIEVTGSKVKFGDTDALLAREVVKGEQKLTLRNEQGIPLWSRGRRR
jgi:hypothetical protein